MKVSELIELLESFREELRDHRKLWGASLAQPIPQYPVRNRKALEEQSDLLARQLGRLRPYLDRFRDSWMMRHPATGVTWDVLDAAVSLQAVAPMKGPSIGSAIEAIDQILGQIEGLDRDDDIPADWGRPIRAGASADRVALGYLPHLHPFIHEGCSRLFQDGHYVQAIEESAKAVLQYLRDKTGLALDGTALAETAFSLKNPVLAFGDLSDESGKNEQLGFMELLKGLAKGVRNPLAHTHGRREEFQKAFEYLVMASLLCRRIDDAGPRSA